MSQASEHLERAMSLEGSLSSPQVQRHLVPVFRSSSRQPHLSLAESLAVNALFPRLLRILNERNGLHLPAELKGVTGRPEYEVHARSSFGRLEVVMNKPGAFETTRLLYLDKDLWAPPIVQYQVDDAFIRQLEDAQYGAVAELLDTILSLLAAVADIKVLAWPRYVRAERELRIRAPEERARSAQGRALRLVS